MKITICTNFGSQDHKSRALLWKITQDKPVPMEELKINLM